MAKLFAIDPGNVFSAYAVIDPTTLELFQFGKIPNDELKEILYQAVQKEDYHFAIEMIASYGMPVGASVFDTCLWIGRFQEIIHKAGKFCNLVYRKEVCMYLCNSSRAGDSNIRQSILDIYPATGGGKTPQVGVKSQPGPLFGVSNDVWAALGVAITYSSHLNPPNWEKIYGD